MENLRNMCDMLTTDCYMTSIDLKKAYYSVAVDKSSKKFLRFMWQDTLYQYRALPNGLASAPRIFTKLVKVIFSILREKDCDCLHYLDDSVFIAKTFDKCLKDTYRAVELLQGAGFSIHQKKSVLEPTQRINFLGFIVDTKKMKIFLPIEKQQKLLTLAAKLLNSTRVTIEDVAQVVGMIVSVLPAFLFGKLHYRGLELDKILGLKTGSYKSIIKLSDYAIDDLNWWISNTDKSGCPIKPLHFEVELFTDASRIGYGAVLNGTSINGKWNPCEVASYSDNINALELLAVQYALMSFSQQLNGNNVCVRIDNSTAVTYINKMGGTHSLQCNAITRKIWSICIEYSIMLSASHIPGKFNIEADFASRNFNDDIEISLESAIFRDICADFDLEPSVDLFASRSNCKVATYASWKPDPLCTYVDAFTLDWNIFNCIYLFPPISLWGRVVSKLETYKGQAIVIFPKWPGQYWYPALTRMLQQHRSLRRDAVSATN